MIITKCDSFKKSVTWISEYEEISQGAVKKIWFVDFE